MVYESWETTWEKIKRQDAEAAEEAKALRIKEREYAKERAAAQQQKDYYLKTLATQASLEKRIAQMRMKTQKDAVEASVSVKTKEVVPDLKPAAQEKDFHSQDPLVIFFDNRSKNKALADRLQAYCLD
jgi:Tfp pilus assembly protein PilE